MRNTSVVLFLGVMPALWAQQPPAMSFEVASVKPTNMPTFPGFALMGEGRVPGGRLSVAAPVSMFIKFAYKLRESPEQERILIHLPQAVSGYMRLRPKRRRAIPARTKCG